MSDGRWISNAELDELLQFKEYALKFRGGRRGPDRQFSKADVREWARNYLKNKEHFGEKRSRRWYIQKVIEADPRHPSPSTVYRRLKEMLTPLGKW